LAKLNKKLAKLIKFALGKQNSKKFPISSTKKVKSHQGKNIYRGYVLTYDTDKMWPKKKGESKQWWDNVCTIHKRAMK
jgi:hypothetical protein